MCLKPSVNLILYFLSTIKLLLSLFAFGFFDHKVLLHGRCAEYYFGFTKPHHKFYSFSLSLLLFKQYRENCKLLL